MCASCFTRIDAMALQSIAAVTAGLSAAGRLRRLWRGEDTAARRVADWDRSAEFLARLGHDPASLLGPRPVELTAPEDQHPADRQPIAV